MAVLNLAIDDGVPSRGHRTNIFKEQFFYTGAGTEPHKVYQSETVVTYSGSNILEVVEGLGSPDIDVPTTLDAYTKYAAWDASCECQDPFSGETYGRCPSDEASNEGDGSQDY